MTVTGSADAPLTIRRILVPLDGSHLAESVLPTAVSLARHLGARLTLLHVMERTAPTTVHGQRHLSEVAEADRYLADVSARVLADGVDTERHVHPNPEGNVSKSMAAHAGDLDADLIVLATHGEGGARRILFGSVAQQVLRRGTRPVLLVRPPDPAAGPPAPQAPPVFRRILLPLDGEPGAEAALPFAVTLGKAYGAEVTLLRIVPTLATITGERASTAKLVPTATAASLDYEEELARGYLEQLAGRFQAAGVRVSAFVGRGDLAQGVLDRAAGSDADLLIMATHGRTGLEAVFSGSVASKVVSRYVRPMLLVQAPAALH